jgi:hypothetical protein
MKIVYTFICLLFFAGSVYSQNKLPTCKGDSYEQWNNCTGTIKGNDGTAYEGDFANGQINGYGLLTLPTGEKVLGKFKNSVLSGRGLLVAKDGSRYAGEFDQNIFNGQGISVLANGERIEGIFRNGQFVEAKKVTDAQILALLASQPVYSSVAVLTGRVDGGNSPAAVAAKTYDTGKIYYFEKGRHGGPQGTCVSKKWGVEGARNVSEGIPYWGMKVYEKSKDKKREFGFFAFNDIEEYLFGTINRGPKAFEKVRDQDWQYCIYLIASGEELNALPVLNDELNNPKNEFKLLHELTLAEAEKEWLNALGFKSLADYSNAATINWQMSGVTYTSLSKLGITNIDQFNSATKRRDSINCPLGYPSNLQGVIAFLTDEAASVKAKKPIESYCSQRADKAKQEINKEVAELRRQELASPLLNCTKVNCTNSAEVESAVRDSWMRLKGKNSPYASNCFDAIKLVKDLRSAGRIFGPDTVTTAFFMCNMGLKELR